MANSKTDRHYTLVVYDSNRHPLGFKVSRSFLKSLYFIVPMLILVAALSILGAGLYVRTIYEKYASVDPERMQNLEQTIQEINIQLMDTQSLNQELEKKLATPLEAPLSGLSLFALTSGMEDRSNISSITIEDFSIKGQGSNTQFSFNIINNLEDGTRLSGYIFTLLLTDNSLYIYPKTETNLSQAVTNYQLGESFSASRFRPVQGRFPVSLEANQAYSVKILLFSRTGDLIYQSVKTGSSN